MNISDIHSIFLESSGVCTDTRQIKKDCIYFALKGANFDGNQFVEQAIQKGAILAISDDKANSNLPKTIIVDDSLAFLQKLANYHRQTFSIPVIGITGTNGKTTSKELTNAVLSSHYRVCATQGNLNNHIGVPLTLLTMNKSHELAIIEMGANHPGEIAELCDIACPNYGLITNVGKAHIEGFGSLENIIATKTALYKSVEATQGQIFVNADDAILTNHIGTCKTHYYSKKSDAELKYSVQQNGISIGIETAQGTINSNLFGEYNAENIAAACLIGSVFSVPFAKIKHAISNYSPTNNRSQTIKTKNNTILLDAYNANPTSMEAAIKNFAKIPMPNKYLILGEMYELGEDSVNEHMKIQQLCKESNLTNVLYVGNWPEANLLFNNAESLASHLQTNPINSATILIKGSRGVRLETIVDYL